MRGQSVYCNTRSAAHAAKVTPVEDENESALGSGSFVYIRARLVNSCEDSVFVPQHSEARPLAGAGRSSADKYSLGIAASAKMSTGHFRAKPLGST
ncbi:hypothetical protein DesyoDRAFT_5273 [Desulfosporosinus youngiae DSM 17734]|uniref:Uncharacterized protein n=1 Tax=Desulfosporosinus youngiae DSM 17734 TaxID=768710 RepID=H5Y0E5_9FIRM|nr:hypothetical protein DesyoDRAFT_5273 [Desulfosporosinus youngiae DSM 17734]